MKSRFLLFLCFNFLTFFFFVDLAAAKRLHKESAYQTAWCGRRDGQAEIRLPDRTRVDCLTGQYAIEFDFASKWAEAIGQSLHYASQTGRVPGIVLVLEKDGDQKYLDILKNVIQHFNLAIKVWTVEPGIFKP